MEEEAEEEHRARICGIVLDLRATTSSGGRSKALRLDQSRSPDKFISHVLLSDHFFPKVFCDCGLVEKGQAHRERLNKSTVHCRPTVGGHRY